MHNVKPQHTAPHHGSDPHTTDMQVGDILRRTRVHYNKSLKDVESDLRIRASQIEAIEDGRTDDLPGKVYAIGFVRAYADHLGLDGDKIVALYKRQNSGWQPKPDFERPAPPAYNSLSPLWIGAFALAGCVLIALAWWIFSPKNDDSAALEIPPVPVAAQDVNTQEMPQNTPEKSFAVESEVTAAAQITSPQNDIIAPIKEPDGMILNITANSWVEIRDSSNDSVLVSRVLKAGEKYFVPDRENLNISIGNAGGVEIQINDLVLGRMGGNGEVLQNQPLSIPAMMIRFPDADIMPATTVPNTTQAPPAQDAPIIAQ